MQILSIKDDLIQALRKLSLSNFGRKKTEKNIVMIKSTSIIQNLVDEVWKDVPGWEGYYRVSNLGRVKSLERIVENAHTSYRKGERLMRGSVNKGLRYVHLSSVEVGKNEMVPLRELVKGF